MKEITDLQRKMLKKYNLDAMVTMTPENITYVTGAYIRPHHYREARSRRHRREH